MPSIDEGFVRNDRDPVAGPTILLCTLGASWAVVAEVFGWLAPGLLDLYAHHPERAALDATRGQHGLRQPDEVWICTSEGIQTQKSLAAMLTWWHLIDAPCPLRIWSAAGTDQLATQVECEHVRELTHRMVLLATEYVGEDGQLVLSLAGGRKTMSADLQSAGALFGAHAWLHVVGPEPLHPVLREAHPKVLALPLESAAAGSVMPLVVGTGRRSELLDIEIDGVSIRSRWFPLPLARSGYPCAWQMPAGSASLGQELVRRQREGSQLLGNFLASVSVSEHHDNWRSLYRLAPAQIATLRSIRLSSAHKDWLIALPKADLHRHLGGCLSIDDQRQVAHAIWDTVASADRHECMEQVRDLLKARAWPWDWPSRIRGERRPQLTAALLIHSSDTQLERNLYEVTAPRIALRTSKRGFSAYERPGELSGSALLAHPAAIDVYARAVVRQAYVEGLSYLELRGSPHKYRPRDPGRFVHDLRRALQRAGAEVQLHSAVVGYRPIQARSPRIGFIWILDRRQPSSLPTVVRQAVETARECAGFVVGLDLAGDESVQDAHNIAPGFAPAFADCVPLTIHAGEGEPPEKIWQAAYHLHADRIGHGLTLAGNPRLMARFRDRGICLELCPTSNREVVGYVDSATAETANMSRYPLREFLDAGLPLTICTDNPAFSRTTIADEYLTAARMTDGSLTLWECLALMRQAFVHAFLPSHDRECLIKHVDRVVYAHLTCPQPGTPYIENSGTDQPQA